MPKFGPVGRRAARRSASRWNRAQRADRPDRCGPANGWKLTAASGRRQATGAGMLWVRLVAPPGEFEPEAGPLGNVTEGHRPDRGTRPGGEPAAAGGRGVADDVHVRPGQSVADQLGGDTTSKPVVLPLAAASRTAVWRRMQPTQAQMRVISWEP